jgi:hypothetical protein
VHPDRIAKAAGWLIIETGEVYKMIARGEDFITWWKTKKDSQKKTARVAK